MSGLSISLGMGVSLMALAAGFSPALTVTYGARSTNYGTTFDYYLSPTGNDTTGDGSLGNPWETLSKIITVTGTSGGTVGLRGGTYTESAADFADAARSSGLKFYAYNGETPVFSGFESLTSWTQCTAGDTIVDGNTSVYKKTVTHGTGGVLPSQYTMNLHEAGVAMPIARFSASLDAVNPAFTTDLDTWLTSDSVTNTGAGSTLDTLTDTTIAATFTAGNVTAQVENAWLMFHAAGNADQTVLIDDFTSDVITVSTATAATQNGGTAATKYTLLNFLGNIAEGHYGIVDHGDGTSTIYVWPSNASNLENGEIKRSVLGQFCDLGEAGKVEFYGVTFEGFAIGNYINPLFKGGATQDTLFQDCTFDKLMHGYPGPLNGGGSSYGIQSFASGSGNKLKYCTINQFLNGIAANLYDTAHLGFCLLEQVERQALRVYSAEEVYIYFTKFQDCVRNPHGNKLAVYINSHNVLVWGCVWEGGNGYVTQQASSGVVWAFNTIPSTNLSTDYRALVNQTYSGAPPAAPASLSQDNWIFNNHFPPNLTDQTTANVQIGATDATVTGVDHFLNNICVGSALAGAGASDNVGDHDGNTAITSIIGRGGKDLLTTNAALWTNGAAGTFTFEDVATKDGPAYRTGASIQSYRATLEAMFPEFIYFDYDQGGYSLDWTAPPAGPVALNGTYTLAAPVVSAVTATADGETDFVGSFSVTHANGQAWWVVSQSATEPSAAQFKAGLDGNGAAGEDSGTQFISASGSQGITSNNSLTTSTVYYLHVMFEDVNGVQDIGISASFDTTPVAYSPLTVEFDGSTYTQALSLTEGNEVVIAMKVKVTSTASLNPWFTAATSNAAVWGWFGNDSKVAIRMESSNGAGATTSGLGAALTVGSTRAIFIKFRQITNTTSEGEYWLDGVKVATLTAPVDLLTRTMQLPEYLNSTTGAAAGPGFQLIGGLWVANSGYASLSYSDFFDGSNNPVFNAATINGVTARFFQNGNAAAWNAGTNNGADGNFTTVGTVTDV